MKDFIKKRLQEDLEYYGVDNSKPESDEYKVGVKESGDKYGELEMDLRQIMQKHQANFAEYEGDSYGIIDAMHQVMDGMFQRV